MKIKNETNDMDNRNILLIAVISLLCSGVPAMEPFSRIDIDGLKDRIPLSIDGVGSGKVEYANWMESGDLNKMYLQCHFEAADWRSGSISFTPMKSGRLSIGLRGVYSKKGERTPWFAFSELAISGAKVNSGEFGDLAQWFLKPKAEVIGDSRVGDTKSLSVSHSACAYRNITVVEGVQINLKFWAKFIDYREVPIDSDR